MISVRMFVIFHCEPFKPLFIGTVLCVEIINSALREMNLSFWEMLSHVKSII